MATVDWTKIALAGITACSAAIAGQRTLVASGAEATQTQQVDAIERFERTHWCVRIEEGQRCDSTTLVCSE